MHTYSRVTSLLHRKFAHYWTEDSETDYQYQVMKIISFHDLISATCTMSATVRFLSLSVWEGARYVCIFATGSATAIIKTLRVLNL